MFSLILQPISIFIWSTTWDASISSNSFISLFTYIGIASIPMYTKKKNFFFSKLNTHFFSNCFLFFFFNFIYIFFFTPLSYSWARSSQQALLDLFWVPSLSQQLWAVLRIGCRFYCILIKPILIKCTNWPLNVVCTHTFCQFNFHT